MPAGILYICATPIGNMEDITLRVLRVLQEADVIAAEDTRRTRKLLAHHGISLRGRSLMSYHRHSPPGRTGELIAALREGRTVALVSDAGMPGLSDPGEELIRVVVESGGDVRVLPGPSAADAALVLSGLPTTPFRFIGFLPRQRSQRRQALERLREDESTLVVFEAPTRLKATLDDMLAVLGDRRIAIARELTKAFEQVVRCRLSEAVQLPELGELRGEVTIVLSGAVAVGRGRLSAPSARVGTRALPRRRSSILLDADRLAAAQATVERLVASGMSRRDAVSQASRELGIRRKDLYAAHHAPGRPVGRASSSPRL